MLIRKNITQGSSLSILKDTNVAFCASDDNLSGVREGSYLRIDRENAFYIILGKEEVLYTSLFRMINPYEIQIDEQVVPQLQSFDRVKLIYKEHELDIIAAILEPGHGYSCGDVLRVTGGKPSVNIQDGGLCYTEITVSAVNLDGGITKIGVKSRGKYTEIPLSENTVTGGIGQGAKFELVYQALPNNTTTEYQISSIDNTPDYSLIRLTLPLPTNVLEGRLSCSKWKLYLSCKYAGESKFAREYSLTRDFTPQLNLPLMAQNSFSVDVVYNQAVNQLETEIVKLQKKVEELEKRVPAPAPMRLIRGPQTTGIVITQSTGIPAFNLPTGGYEFHPYLTT